jgi:hypothetical protein
LDKKFSMVTYNDWTIIWLTCIRNIPKIGEDIEFSKVLHVKQFPEKTLKLINEGY